MPSPQRIWFPHRPDGTISAADRARHGVGMVPSGGIARPGGWVEKGAATGTWVEKNAASDTWVEKGAATV